MDLKVNESMFINGCIFSSIQCFFGSILCCSQSGDDPQDDLAMFGYKLNMKAVFKKRHPAIFLATYLNCV